MDETFSSVQEQLPPNVDHLAGLPTINLDRLINVQAHNIMLQASQPRPGDDPGAAQQRRAAAATEVGQLHAIWGEIIDGPPNEPVVDLMGRLGQYAGDLRDYYRVTGDRVGRGLPSDMASEEARNSLADKVTQWTQGLAGMKREQLEPIVGPFQAPASVDQGPLHYPNLAKLSVWDLGDYVGAKALVLQARGERPNLPGAIQTGLAQEAAVQRHIAQRLGTSANRGDSPDVALQELGKYKELLTQSGYDFQGPLRDPAFRQRVVTAIGALDRELVGITPEGLHEAVAQARAPQPGAAQEQAGSGYSAEPQQQPQPESSPGPGEPEPESNADDPEREQRREFLTQMIDMSAELKGTGLYADIPEGDGYKVGLGGFEIGDDYPLSGRRGDAPNQAKSMLNIWHKLDQLDPDFQKFKTTGDVADLMTESIAFTSGVTGQGGKDLKHVTTSSGDEGVTLVSYIYQSERGGSAAREALEAAATAKVRMERGSVEKDVRMEHSGGGRGGGIHAYCIEVPNSTARQFQKLLRQNPTAARELGELLVMRYGSETYQQLWTTQKQAEQAGKAGTDELHYTAYPPYNQSPPGTKMRMYTVSSAGYYPTMNDDYLARLDIQRAESLPVS